VSTGEILRKAAREQTPLGKEAVGYLNRGALVPDDVMLQLVAERLHGEDCGMGFVLDGFPRTIAQAEGLATILRGMGCGLDGVFFFQVPRGVIIQRLAGRRTCKRCGTLYHRTFDPPAREAICDRCGGELDQREDDREETVTQRLDVYETQTAPLIDYYRKQGLLTEIDGVGGVGDIKARVFQALQESGR
jgi:adenylate kinase